MVEATEAAQKEYVVPFSYKKIFTPEECNEFIRSFKNYDVNKDGSMDAKEFAQVVKDLGYNSVTTERISELLKMVDKDESGRIEFDEFLEMWSGIKQKTNNFGDSIDTK